MGRLNSEKKTLLVSGLFELLCGTHFMTGKGQAGHTLQDLWPGRIPDEPVCSPNHILSRKTDEQ